MIVCPYCWTLYADLQGESFVGLGCPRENCTGRLADIDELLLPILLVLNEKMYHTDGGASGHFYDGVGASSFISFHKCTTEENLPSLPKGFVVEDQTSGEFVIRRDFLSTEQNGLHREVLQTALDLLEWAIALPPKTTK